MEEYVSKRFKSQKKFLTVTIITVFAILTGIYGMSKNLANKEDAQEAGIKKISQTLEIKENKIQEENAEDISAIIEKSMLSVVGISKVKDTGSTVFLKNGITQLGLGTGIIVTTDGYILTNEHVSGERYSSCYITLENGNIYRGSVVWADKDIDLSIIKINAKNLTPAQLGNSDEIKVGQNVYAIGNPIGYEFQRTVTSGIISGIDRTVKIEENDEQSYLSNLIQTDATVNFGNSGGPLINFKGEVIGINSLKITSAEGISFALPINLVKSIIQRFSEEGNFEEASIGIFAYDKNVIQYIDKKIDFDTGIYVVQVSNNSSAYNSGLREKDIILSIDNVGLEKMSDLRKYIYTKNVGDEVNLKVLRNKEQIFIKMKLIKK